MTQLIDGFGPYQNYTASVSTSTVIGNGPVATTTGRTLPDSKCYYIVIGNVFIFLFSLIIIVPGNAPQNFTSIPTKTTVLFTWARPTTPNGKIIEYFLNVTNLDTLFTYSYVIAVRFNTQTTASHVIQGFSPYQNYTASVSASTVIGAGPVATTTGRTLPGSKT